MLAAAEAVIEAALLVDVKARRLLFVKRAKPDVRAPAADELHRFADELDEAGLLPDPIDRLLSDHSSSPAAEPTTERAISRRIAYPKKRRTVALNVMILWRHWVGMVNAFERLRRRRHLRPTRESLD